MRTRGRTLRGRSRGSPGRPDPTARPLLKTTDHGYPLEVRAHAIGASGERWVEPFLQANASSMQRMSLQVDVCADSEVYVRLTPGARIGAVPLVGPATRRVVAGILVEPRFRWPALVAVFNSIGFTIEPTRPGRFPPGPGLRRAASSCVERMSCYWQLARARRFVRE